ncbi:MAG: butyrate kinase [Erysipelotrichaceae bacterium]|nr:butyrate kinase [Erysipelotrichaceae bacterium]
MSYKIFTINPGSTSTKIALFDGEKELFSANVRHEADKLKTYATVSDQLPYREETIMNELAKAGIDLSEADAFCGRGGGLLAVEGGTYSVNETLLDHATAGANGVQHPAQLGPQLAKKFADKYGKKAYVVNPPDTDELQDVARVTGIKGVYRNVHLHALNLKETAIRHAASQGKKYEEQNYIVCHIGGGTSISAHRQGLMVDGYDIVGGEGPMTPTRCGAVPMAEAVRYMDKTGKTVKEMLGFCMKNGGFVDHLGTSDAIEVTRMAANGNQEAALVWEAMIYQINKAIGSMASVLEGKVDGILLGGGMVHNRDLVKAIEKTNGWIAPVYAYPGEFEMEAMASGVIRVLEGKEALKEYTGIPRWRGFGF